MEIRPPTDSDWQQFDRLAMAEGWRVPESERVLFRSAWRDAAGVLINGERFCGLVTAVCHGKSGWIGNLIVPPELRGQGYGGRLFRWAMEHVSAAGVRSVWLTASELGRPIYEKEDFVSVDRVERWVRQPAPLNSVSVPSVVNGTEQLANLDLNVWGEPRPVLHETLLPAGRSAACNGTAALLQPGDDVQVLGPWYSEDFCPPSNRIVLQQLIAAADPAVEIVADLLASSPLRFLAAAMHFEKIGQVELMVYGDRSHVDLRGMASLASLGSFG
jgi:GNAT superfamily N-acetyltransferase